MPSLFISAPFSTIVCAAHDDAERLERDAVLFSLSNLRFLLLLASAQLQRDDGSDFIHTSFIEKEELRGHYHTAVLSN